jgi:hypothetical protein
MYYEVTYGYKGHCGVQVLSVGGSTVHTEAQARGMFHHIRPKESGFYIIEIKPH